MPPWDLVITDANLATMRPGSGPFGIVENAAIAVREGRIAWLGKSRDLPAGESHATLSAEGQWLTPGLIDSHTHLVFGGNRAQEFEQRLNGVSYEAIARSGGGIMSTVRATRAATDDELLAAAGKRMRAMQQNGVTTVEIKSGYGLDLETELRLLRIARKLGEQHDMNVYTTFLGAHAVPQDFAGDADDFVDFICGEAMPAVHAAGLADAVDAYCEKIAFSTQQIARVFEAARALGLDVKLHADQLSACGGAELAARFAALSADHLEYTSPAGVAALADAGTVAVLLPGAFVTLRETQVPPVDLLREKGVPIALATDCNPGTSPIASLRAIMALATSQFRMTPEECLAGVTRHAARALGIENERGTLEEGKIADLAQWDIDHPRELSYWMGLNELSCTFCAGRRSRDQ
ncbi:MAG: imidazolonepropionase [Woeseia sp.]|nr:imidazolonepropionase [Woeseia sp.]MBT8097852.1 imidazolonepropionase [Woeseia sp.]NNE60292.1 imidazolonepropionase [Woeseia sp.]NNL55974.1 imidazolonepropionase [Woeseia sp.]